MGRVIAYSLASRGVVVDTSDVHASDADLLHAQNIQVDAVGGRGSIRRRDGLLPLNAIPLAGPVLGGIGVPLSDRTLRGRTFYLALNDGINSWMTSPDGAVWTTVTTPLRPVREATIGLDTGQAFGDSAMAWQGFGEVLIYPGDDYSLGGGLALPSLHSWNGTEDVILGYVPTNPLDLANTTGPFGITSLAPFSETQILIAVADRNSSGQGRSRVLLLDTRNGTFQQLGASAVLSAGHVVTGLVVWQRRVWITGVNRTTGGALVTFWINADPSDAEWTQDDSFGTQHGFCTGLAVFKGDLYQSSAAESGQSALIRRRVSSSAGSSTIASAVSVGSTSVLGVSTVAARPSPTAISAGPAGGGGFPDQYGDWRAQYTFKYADGVESLPSPASNAVSIPTDFIAITVTAPVGDVNVIQRLIYLKKPTSTTYDGNVNQTLYNTPGVFTIPDNTTPSLNVGAQTLGSTRHPPTTVAGYAAGASYIYVNDISQFYSGGGSVKVGSNTFTYVSTTGASGVGALIGVLGITSTIAIGDPIVAVFPAGSTLIPVADTTNFFPTGTATVGGNTITWTGLTSSLTVGAGHLTGVSGVSTTIVAGSAVVASSVPIGATKLPIADTSNFSATGGSTTAAGQAITYTGKSTTSGRGFLTGVSGITVAIANGATVSTTTPAVTVWTTVYTSGGTGANNYVGPLIVTADAAKILAFQNSVSGGSTPLVRILVSSDGVNWTIEYNISAALSNSYGRSGMPILDDNGDIYWPLASGSAGSATGGLLKRTAAGVWSIVLGGLTNIRGPLGILRTAG